jgi:hypothetical protein
MPSAFQGFPDQIASQLGAASGQAIAAQCAGATVHYGPYCEKTGKMIWRNPASDVIGRSARASISCKQHQPPKPAPYIPGIDEFDLLPDA